MTEPPPTLRAWTRLARLPGGHWLFARFAQRLSPHAARLRPRYRELRAGHVELQLKQRRVPRSSDGALDPLAVCDAAALAAAAVAAITIPPTHRWSFKGLDAEWLRSARGDVTAIAELDLIPALGEAADIPVLVQVRDADGESVLRLTARIRALRGAH